MQVTDIYDFRAPGFVPDEFNSLLLSELDETLVRGANDLKAAADGIVSALRSSKFDYGDTEIIVYDGDLYMVGDYIRHLAEKP